MKYFFILVGLCVMFLVVFQVEIYLETYKIDNFQAPDSPLETVTSVPSNWILALLGIVFCVFVALVYARGFRKLSDKMKTQKLIVPAFVALVAIGVCALFIAAVFKYEESAETDRILNVQPTYHKFDSKTGKYLDWDATKRRWIVRKD